MTGIGLRPEDYGTHSLRRTKASLIYKQTGTLRAVQILLGHTKIESTARYLGVDIVNGGLIPGHSGGVKTGQFGCNGGGSRRALFDSAVASEWPVGFGQAVKARTMPGWALRGRWADCLFRRWPGFAPPGQNHCGRLTAASRLFEAVAVAVHGQDVDMVGEPVEQRADEPLGPQDRRPVFKGQV